MAQVRVREDNIVCNRPGAELFDYLDPTSASLRRIRFRNPTVVRVEEPAIAILAQCRDTCENSTDRMGIMEPSLQTSVLIHTLMTSHLQSCLLLAQKQGDKQKNVLPPLTSWIGKGSKKKKMELSGDEKAGNRW